MVYNGGPYELIVLHFLLGVACYIGREWELSFHLGMHPWIAIAYSTPIAATTIVFLIYPIGQGNFSDGMPLGISDTFNMLGVAGVFSDSLFSAMHGSLGGFYVGLPITIVMVIEILDSIARACKICDHERRPTSSRLGPRLMSFTGPNCALTESPFRSLVLTS
ncbi:Photosystem II protein D1 [Hibiscus syriacus]|uniref:Photosystem II protein D1 n=1 Tax=Hibiscus syriacus TaxID=106335 RepID=A0A6A3D1F7_HIBSY|nr:Photosystem II protein D1 [Hibiscus syriacus]